MSYLYETHCHGSLCSKCAQSRPSELVQAYHRSGYAGLVLTDHFVTGNTAVDRSQPWADQMHRYYDAYLEARRAAEGLDFDVIFGIEHACEGWEFLCYGIDLPFLLENADLPRLPLSEFSARVHAYGGLVIQAHPFRWVPAGTPLPLEHVDGIEIFNAGNHPEGNANAMAIANDRLILTSGGDIHRADDPRIGTAGILLPHRTPDAQALTAALRTHAHRPLLP